MIKILIVEDNPQNSDLLKDVLETWNYTVKIVEQGLEAMPAILAFKPVLILLDIMLPGMSGFEVCTKLRKNKSVRWIPIILCTVLDSVEDRIHGYEVGAEHFMVKPLNYNELKQIISLELSHKRKFDSMEKQGKVLDMLLELAEYKAPGLQAHNNIVLELCKKILARNNSLSLSPCRVLMTAKLLGVAKVLGDRTPGDPYKFLDNLFCGRWLKTLLKLVETPQENFPSKSSEFYGEWQILTLVNKYFQELQNGKISKHLIIGILKADILAMGIEKDLLTTFEQIIASEDLIFNLKM